MKHLIIGVVMGGILSMFITLELVSRHYVGQLKQAQNALVDANNTLLEVSPVLRKANQALQSCIRMNLQQ